MTLYEIRSVNTHLIDTVLVKTSGFWDEEPSLVILNEWRVTINPLTSEVRTFGSE